MKITENVIQLESTRQSHAFLVLGEEHILIDTGMPGLADKILAELDSLGAPPSSIRKILLTHHDVDHMGNAKRLQEATGAELFAPRADLPYITGQKNRPGVKRLITAITRPQVPAVTGVYAQEQRFGAITALHAPGHTPGHTIFRYQSTGAAGDNSVFAGDTIIFAGDLFKYIGGRFRLSPGFMNWDMAEVRKSLSLLKALKFDWLCPAHGNPVQNGPAVQAFLAQF
jgi:Zn-dependent hydrolases, including glyoxylases